MQTSKKMHNFLHSYLFGFGNKMDESGLRMKYSSDALLIGILFFSLRGILTTKIGASTFGRSMQR